MFINRNKIPTVLKPSAVLKRYVGIGRDALFVRENTYLQQLVCTNSIPNMELIAGGG